MSAAFAQIIETKDAERRRLRELPWRERLEMLDQLRERQLLLGFMKPHVKKRQPA